jgi:Sec-independent protein secretion pathway component TatC
MQPRLKNPSNTPLSVVLIVNAFLFVGGVVLAISVLILLLGWFLYMDRHANVPGTERIGLAILYSNLISFVRNFRPENPAVIDCPSHVSRRIAVY